MTALDKATAALREIEPELAEPPKEGIDSVNLAERIRGVRKLLSEKEPRWVGLAKAKRLLAASSEDAVKAWVRMRFLRSRTLSNGRTQVLLDDVLRQRETEEGLSAIGGRDLTEEELEEMYQARPGTVPWEREQAADRSG
jgi:hypothetical protein